MIASPARPRRLPGQIWLPAAIVVIAPLLVGASCEGCPDTTVELTMIAVDDGDYRAVFGRDVLLEEGDARDDGLLIEISDGGAIVGRYQPSRRTAADGIVQAAEILDARTVLIRVDPARAADIEPLDSPLDFTVRADTAGACAGPTGRAEVSERP